MSSVFEIRGLAGARGLSGTVSVSGAKNAVLPALAAALMVPGTVSFINVPDIEDVKRMEELLEGLSVVVKNGGNSVEIDATRASSMPLKEDVATRLRASVFLSGPMLARFGRVQMPHPGGDVIGIRPIDLFLGGFERMGAEVSVSEYTYDITVSGRLRGARIFFPFVSVGATETLMMAAVLAEGETVLENAAMEPEVVFLASFLNACGARIVGAGTTTIRIEGVDVLTPPAAPIKVIPDRLETGTYLILGALACTKLTVSACDPHHVQALVELLRQAGATLVEGVDSITITTPEGGLTSVNVRTHEYPGFATDLQAPMTVLLTQTHGESMVFETIFEGRLNYTQDLVRMGADITQAGNHRAIIKGPRKLFGRELEGPDIRAGLAYVLAAIIADGESTISNAYHIDRGYENVDEKLRNLGVSIRRI